MINISQTKIFFMSNKFLQIINTSDKKDKEILAEIF